MDLRLVLVEIIYRPPPEKTTLELSLLRFKLFSFVLYICKYFCRKVLPYVTLKLMKYYH